MNSERKRRKIPLNNMTAAGQQKTIENMMETAEISPVDATKSDHLGSSKLDGIASIKPKDVLKASMEANSAQTESNKTGSSQIDELQTLPNQGNTSDGLQVKKVAKELVVLSTEQREAASMAAIQTTEASKGEDPIILFAEKIGVESVDNLLTEPNRKDTMYISPADLSKGDPLEFQPSQLTKAESVEMLQEPSSAEALVSLKAGSKKANSVRTDEPNKVDVEESLLPEPTKADIPATNSLAVLPRKTSVKELDVLPIQLLRLPSEPSEKPSSKADALLLGQGGGLFANNTDNKQDELKNSSNKTTPFLKQTGRPYFSSVLDQLIGGHRHGTERTSRTVVDTESGGHEWRVSKKFKGSEDADDSGDLKQGESVHQFHYQQVEGDPAIVYTTDIREEGLVSRWDGNDDEISSKNLEEDSIISQYGELPGKSLSYH
jgi:hypothetical protein